MQPPPPDPPPPDPDPVPFTTFATSDVIINNSFITDIAPANIKQSTILNAQLTYIKPALTVPLYEAVTSNLEAYSTLVNTYIIPTLSFYVKYLVFNSLFIEKAATGTPLIDNAYSTTSLPDVRQQAIQDILRLAQNHEKAMISYIISQAYPQYTPPPPPSPSRLVSGFLV